MNWKKILTIAALTGFSASVATGQGTAPTIVQGDYISNVFGQSNFIKNPNAKLNAKDVTVSSATVSRSATTPLVATSEFNVAVTLANGTATWATRTFDAGMKNQNCEARFSYRGFQSTSKAQVKQGANVVAELALSATGTDPRIASINFPCGDLSQPTTFVVTDTAVLAGTNEIGGIYVGLATNQANVAQAETVVIASGANQTITNTGTFQTVIYTSESSDVYGEYNTSTGVFTAKRAGRYLIDAAMIWDTTTWAAGDNIEIRVYKGTTAQISQFQEFESATAQYRSMQINGIIDVAVGETITIAVTHSSGTNKSILNSSLYNYFHISRFPLSSELVVTPERQNTWGGVKYSGNADSAGITSATYVTVPDSSFGTRTLLGNAKAASSTCGLTSGDFGFCMENVPPGTYQVINNNSAGVFAGNAFDTCVYRIAVSDGTITQYAGEAFVRASIAGSGIYDTLGNGVIKLDSLAKNLSVKLETRLNTASGACLVRSDSTLNRTTLPSIVLKPLDQPSNSALYVQGPVQASATGAAIPEGYVNEFSTRSISDTTLRQQTSPAVNTFYYPWTSTLTLPAGNWMLCYKALIEVNQTVSSGNIAYVKMHIQNQTDSTEVMTNASLGQLLQTPYVLEYLWVPVSQCKPIAITSSKTFRMGIGYGNNTGIASVNALKIRGDINQTELYAIRLN